MRGEYTGVVGGRWPVVGGRGSVAGIVRAMPLDDLLETIETLRGRIQNHGPLLSQNEIRTRYALIDPLLGALGWDVADPSQVVAEHPLPTGRVDYALATDAGPAILLEAKSLGTPLEDVARNQAMNYWWDEEIDHFAVTDGQQWGVYSASQRGSPIVQFDLLRDSPTDVCLKALALWRPSVAEGHVRASENPVVKVAPSPAPPDAAQPSVPPSVGQTTRASPSESQVVWVSLTRVTGKPGTKPALLRPPSGQPISAPSWAALVLKLVEWLISQGKLSEASPPLKVGGRYVLAGSPIHPSGTAFKRAHQVGLFHVETNYSGADSVRNARLVAEHAGMNPAEFMVRLAD